MITDEKLNNLYAGVVKETELSTKQMADYGFSSEDLKELIDNGSIELVKSDYYSFKSVEQLFRYGKKLIAKKEYEQANLCFEKCYELDSNHLGVCFQLFLKSIQERDYERCFFFYEKLMQSENEYYLTDNNFYLYLLSIITEVSEKYRDYAKYLKFDNIKIADTDQRYEDIPTQNVIRKAVIKRKFGYALKELNALITKQGKTTVQDLITKILLIDAQKAENISKNTIIELVKVKKYEEINTYLFDKLKRHYLSIIENYILKIVKAIIELQKTKKVPQKGTLNVNTLFDAIDNCDYKEALRLSSEYNEKNHINNNTSPFYYLLNDICNLIDSLTKEEEEVKNENVIQPITLSTIISALTRNEIDSALNNLNKFLESINKSNYEFLIVNLIKLSLLDRDFAFTQPMLILTLISRDNYVFNISNYIEEFYISLSKNKLSEAKIYLDIIAKANSIGEDYINTDGLYQALQVLEERKLDDSKVIQDKETIVENKPVEEKNKPKKIVRVINDIDRDFIATKHEELVKNGGVILLKPMDEIKIDNILDLVDNYPDMVAFVIKDDNNERIVLRYKPIIRENININNLINLGIQAYNQHNYNECIKINLKLLQVFKEPRTSIYSRLGLSYMRLQNIPLAIDYLTIANSLAKKEKLDYDYADIILKLKGGLPKEDVKPYFKMKETDFDYNDMTDYYGIDNFVEINSFIIESGLDVESACEQLNIPKEQIDVIKIIYAREFYREGNFSQGDLFLKDVEKSKNKSKNTTKLLEKVRKNRKFYQNRQVEKSQQLVLSLIPKKSSK